MSNENIEFVKFGVKPRDNCTYALDRTGTVWVNVGIDEWESVSENEPRHIKRGLTAGEVMLMIQQQKRRIGG